VTKHQPGAFYETGLERILRRRGATQVVVCGISTSVGVESTIRSAFDHGYNVVAVTDAMTDRDADSHRHSVEKVFPRMAENCSAFDVLAQLSKRANTAAAR
jgi:nicotinamidase-related amidase